MYSVLDNNPLNTRGEPHSTTRVPSMSVDHNVSNKRKRIHEREYSKKEGALKTESNLSKSEIAGLKSLKKRVESKELIITEMDKSRRFCVLRYEQYIKAGSKHTKGDMELSWDQVYGVQKVVNDHCKWLRSIFRFGMNWGHKDRFSSNMVDRGEIVAPLYLLVKDHKGWSVDSPDPPLSRPVCSGNQGFNRHLSEVLSMILEPLCHSIPGNDIDSILGLLEKITSVNETLKNNECLTNERAKKSPGKEESRSVVAKRKIKQTDLSLKLVTLMVS